MAKARTLAVVAVYATAAMSVLVIAYMVLSAIELRQELTPNPTTAAPPQTTSPNSEKAKPKRVSLTRWTYHTGEKDEMRGTTSEYAKLFSTDILNFDFPYHGGATVEMVLTRLKGQKSIDAVWLSVSNGQISCLHRCQILVKFDHQKSDLFWAETYENTTVLYFLEEDQFVRRLKRSQRVLIEVPFYPDRSKQVEFSTAGLKW